MLVTYAASDTLDRSVRWIVDIVSASGALMLVSTSYRPVISFRHCWWLRSKWHMGLCHYWHRTHTQNLDLVGPAKKSPGQRHTYGVRDVGPATWYRNTRYSTQVRVFNISITLHTREFRATKVYRCFQRPLNPFGKVHDGFGVSSCTQLISPS